MPNEHPDTDPMIKTISGSRLKRLIEIDAFLSRRGSEDNPATIAEICDEPEYLRLDLEDRIGKMKALYESLSDHGKE